MHERKLKKKITEKLLKNIDILSINLTDKNRKLNKIKVGVAYNISPAYRLKKGVLFVQLSRSLY